VIHAYAQRRPLRAMFLVLVAIILVDFSADDGCDCGDAYPRSVAQALKY
jgi:hypothetical protein